MAKAKKKTASKAGRASVPTAALYNVDASTPRGKAIRETIAAQGLRVLTIAPERLGDPVGAIAGMTGFRPTRTPYEGEAPTCEFMLLCNAGNAQLNKLLAAMREADCSVGCKAQVTQFNRLWPMSTLIAEVAKEHEAMNQPR